MSEELGIETDLDGEYTLEQACRLTWPIAWQGTVSEARRAEEEGRRARLQAEIAEALLDAPARTAEVRGGRVVAVVLADDESE